MSVITYECLTISLSLLVNLAPVHWHTSQNHNIRTQPSGWLASCIHSLSAYCPVSKATVDLTLFQRRNYHRMALKHISCFPLTIYWLFLISWRTISMGTAPQNYIMKNIDYFTLVFVCGLHMRFQSNHIGCSPEIALMGNILTFFVGERNTLHCKGADEHTHTYIFICI